MSNQLVEPWPPGMENDYPVENASVQTTATKKNNSVSKDKAIVQKELSSTSSTAVRKQKINLDLYKSNALIGLEYTIELQSNSSRDVDDCHYICSLCNMNMIDKNQVLKHWISYEHRLNYMHEHYSRAIKECQILNYKSSTELMKMIVNELASAIEKCHGRTSLSVTHVEDYRLNEKKIKDDILMKYHPNEYSGSDFVDIVRNNNWLDKCKMKDIVINSKKLKNNKYELSENKNANNKNDTPLEEANKTPLTPKELSLQASQIAQKQYKWEKYYCMIENQLKELEAEYDIYKRTPERHPRYFDEWREFWNRRYRELQQEKKHNPMEYDYKPEWMLYWTTRSRDLFRIKFNNMKRDIKIKLGLPEDAEENIEEYNIHKYYKASAGLPITTYSKNSPDNDEYLEDSNEMHLNNLRDYYKRSNSGYYSSNEQSENGLKYTYNPANSTFHRLSPEMLWENADLPLQYSQKRTYKQCDRDAERSPLTVVSVLRLLTALEDILGSLGPKVIQLLSQALTLEKNKANLSEELLNNKDNYVLLETIKEKLKGILIAEVVYDEHKIRVIKKAIQYIATLLYKAKINYDDVLKRKELQTIVDNSDTNDPLVTLMEWNCPTPVTKRIKITPDRVNSVDNRSPKKLPFDRQVIVNELNDLLALNCVDDISVEEINKLVDFFFLMCKIVVGKRSIDSEPLTISDFKLLFDFANKGRKKKRKIKDKVIESSNNRCQKNENIATTSRNITDNFDEINEGEDLVHRNLPTNTISIDTTVDNVNNDDETLDSSDIKKDENENVDKNLLESLTDSDLQTLLKNFKRLLVEEQHHLILYLRRLESTDMERVEKLRKYVNLGDSVEEIENENNNSDKETQIEETNNSIGEINEVVNTDNFNCDINTDSYASTNTEPINVNPNKFILNDDDDDYNFDEVCKTVSLKINKPNKERNKISINLRKNSLEKLKQLPEQKTSVSDTENLVANIMSSLRKRNCTNITTNHDENSKRIDNDEVENIIKDSSSSQLLNDSSNAQNLNVNNISEMSNVTNCNFNSLQKQTQNLQLHQPSADLSMKSDESLYQSNRPYYQQQQQQQIYNQMNYNQYAANAETYYNIGENYNQNYGNNNMSYDQWQLMQQNASTSTVPSVDRNNYNPYANYQQIDPAIERMYYGANFSNKNS